MYKITPPKYSLIGHRDFVKGDKEVTWSTLWEMGCISFSDLPDFLENYDPLVGVILGEQTYFVDGEYIGGETSYFYTENVTSKELEEVEIIIKNMKGDEYFEKTDWSWGKLRIVMLGDLEIEDHQNRKYQIKNRRPEVPFN